MTDQYTAQFRYIKVGQTPRNLTTDKTPMGLQSATVTLRVMIFLQYYMPCDFFRPSQSNRYEQPNQSIVELSLRSNTLL